MPLESMDVDSVLKTKKCIAIDTNKLIFVIGIRSKGRLNSYYWFLNAENPLELYEMLNDKLAIRAAIQDTVIPNIEIKFTKNMIDRDSLQKHMEVKIDRESLNISPLEIQIPFKLYFGSDKDIEDAVYLYEEIVGKVLDSC